MSAPTRPGRNRARGIRLRRRPASPVRIHFPHPHVRRAERPSLRLHSQRFVLAFAGLIVGGAVLLALPWTTESGETTPPADALFTAVSAACVTGLVTVDTASHWNGAGEAVILLLMQLGGLSFMVGASIVLQLLRRGESLRDALLLRDGEPAMTLQQVSSLSGRILRFTLAVEAVGAVVLALRFWLGREEPVGRAIWLGVFYSVSGFCNAGFDLAGGFRSLIPYRTDIVVLLTIAALTQLGSLSYLVLHEVAAERRWSRLSLDAKLVLLGNAVLVVAGAVVFLGLEWGDSLGDRPGWAKPFAALFQSVQARSGGFTAADLSLASQATVFALVALMMAGGASGSTAGGVRVTTVAVVVAAVVATLRGEQEPQVFGRRIPTAIVFRALTVIALFMVAHFCATLLLAIAEDLWGEARHGFVTLLFEAMSALATDGLSTGITPSLSTASKLVLCATMFLGRLGPLTVVVALQRRQAPARYRYPEAPVRIG